MNTEASVKETLRQLLHHSPAYGRLAFRLLRDGRIPARQKAPLAAAAGYCVSPIDLVPGFVPVLGQLDDLMVLLGALRFVLNETSTSIGDEHLLAVGLSRSDIDADLAAAWRASRTIVVSGARGAAHIAGRGARLSFKLARAGFRNIRQRNGDLPTAQQP